MSPEYGEKLNLKSAKVYCPEDDPKFIHVVNAVITDLKGRYDVGNQSKDDFCCLCRPEKDLPDVVFFHPEYDGWQFDPRCFNEIKKKITDNPEVNLYF